MTVRLSPDRFRKHPTAVGPLPLRSSDDVVRTPTGPLTDSVSEVGAVDTSDPPPAAVAGEETGTEPVITSDGDTGHRTAAGDSRIALREARQQRRRIAWICAAFVAVCLGLTIVAVSLARTRPAPSGIIDSYAAALSSTPAPGSPPPPSDPQPGAPASEGDIR